MAGSVFGGRICTSVGNLNEEVMLPNLSLKLRLVTDNLFIYAEANWEATESVGNLAPATMRASVYL